MNIHDQVAPPLYNAASTRDRERACDVMADRGRGSPCDFHPYQNHTWLQLHAVVVDKEYQLDCVKDELQRLSLHQQESARKDELIRTLRKEIAEYKKCTQDRDIGFASVEEQLSSCESHLQERVRDIQVLQSELKSAEDKLKSVMSKYASAQRDLSKLSQASSQHEKEMKELRQQQRSDSETISTLQRELVEKKSGNLSSQERVKRFRSENQELQKKIECLQAEREVMTATEKKLKSEVARLKNHSSNGQLWQAKYDLNEQELLKAKDKELNMLAELGRIESELSDLRNHILTSFSLDQSSPESVFNLVSQFAEEYFKAQKRLTLVEQDLEQHEEEMSALTSDVAGLCEIWKEFQGEVPSNAASAITHLAENLQKTVVQNENIQELLETMKSVSTLQSVAEENREKLTQLENHIRSCYQSQKDASEVEDVATMISNMASLAQSSELEISKLKERLVEMDLEHSAALSGAITALRQDEQTRLNDVIAKTRAEEEEKRCKELKSAEEEHIVDKQEAVLREQEITASLRKEIEDLKLAINTEAAEKEGLQAKLEETNGKLVNAELSKSQAISETDSFKALLQQQFTDQLAQYREQAQQYALTIVAMEEKLRNLTESCKTLQTENQNLLAQTDGSTATYKEETKIRDEKIRKMEELIGVLRNQLQLASVDGGRKESTISEMESQICSLNQEAEENRAQMQQLHCEELSDLQLTMAKQEAIIECQKTEIENLREKLEETTTELADQNQQYVKVAEEFKEIQKKMEGMDVSRQGHVTLTEQGHVCFGEKHQEIIRNQRTTIAQLRERVSELEQAKPPIGSHQATLKELSRVRHELLKVKSTLPRDRTEVENARSKDQTTSIPQFTFMEESQQQKVSLEQIEETLQCSERMYKNLVEVICQGLRGVTRVPLESEDQLTANDDQGKKKQVLKGRKKFADNVCRQLAKLDAVIKSNAEMKKADAASSEVDPECSVVEKKPEEIIADLEAVLTVTAEELEQQKKLNQSLLKRKNFKEAQLLASMHRPRHVCS